MKKQLYAQVNKPFSIAIREEKYPISMPDYHYHNAYEIYYLCKGERYYFIKDKTYHVKAGSLVLINKYDIHSTANIENLGHKRILVTFKKEFIANQCVGELHGLFECFEKDVHIVELNEEERKFVENHLEIMNVEYCSGKAGNIAYLQCSLVQLMIFIKRFTMQTIEAECGHIDPTHKFVSDVIGYINNNYFEDITLQILSERFYFNIYYISRVFKSISGVTLPEYLNSVRIKEAQRLMAKGDKNISEIAEAVGYNSSTHFGRVFKKITGVSPMEYKKKM